MDCVGHAGATPRVTLKRHGTEMQKEMGSSFCCPHVWCGSVAAHKLQFFSAVRINLQQVRLQKNKCEREQRKSSFFSNNVSFSLLQEKMEMTGTFKQQKFQLVDEGFNPSTITDPLYFLDNSKKAYVLLTKELHEMILSGKMRL